MARGQGTTTKQMQDATKGAHYVWVNGHLDYPRALAQKIGRQDLVIVSPEFFSGVRWMGFSFKGIVLDHATDLNDSQWQAYDRACSCIRPE